MSEATVASAAGLPWWGWLIIGVVALIAIFYGVVVVLVVKAHRTAARELDGWINLGPSRRARSHHYTDPF